MVDAIKKTVCTGCTKEYYVWIEPNGDSYTFMMEEHFCPVSRKEWDNYRRYQDYYRTTKWVAW
jgi:hypothetical protein